MNVDKYEQYIQMEQRLYKIEKRLTDIIKLCNDIELIEFLIELKLSDSAINTIRTIPRLDPIKTNETIKIIIFFDLFNKIEIINNLYVLYNCKN